MRVLLTSDEVNVLLQRYLLENGFVHAAFAFQSEACMKRNPYWQTHADRVPPNALVSLLQKALLFIHIEYHTGAEGSAIPCDEPFSFFRRHECWSKTAIDASGETQAAASAAPVSSGVSASLLGATPRNSAAAAASVPPTSSSAVFSTTQSSAGGPQRRGSAASLDVSNAAGGGDASGGAGMPFAGSDSHQLASAVPAPVCPLSAETSQAAAGGVSGGAAELTCAASEEALRAKRGAGGTCRNQRNKKKAVSPCDGKAPSRSLSGRRPSLGENPFRCLLGRCFSSQTRVAAAGTRPPATPSPAQSGAWESVVALETEGGASSSHAEQQQALASAPAAIASQHGNAAGKGAAAGGGVGPSPTVETAGESAALGFLEIKEKRPASSGGASGEAAEEGAASSSLEVGAAAGGARAGVLQNKTGGDCSEERGGGGEAETGEAEACIFLGPPLAALERRTPLRDFVRLVEVQDVGEAGALSEWSPADPELLVTNSQQGSVLSAQPDGRLLATGYESGDVLVWKSNGEALSFLQGGGGGHPVICVAFSPSAKFLAAAAADGTVVVWKVLKKNDATEAKADAAEPEWSFEEVRVYRHCSDAQEAGSGGAGAMKGVIDLDWSSEDLLAAGAVDGRIVVLGMDPPSEIAVPLGKRRVPSATPSLVSLKENEKTPEERGPSGSEHLAGGGGSGETREAQQEASTGEAEMKAADELKAEPGETPAGGEALVEETAEVASVRWDSTGKLLAVVDSSSSVGLWNAEEPTLRPLALTGHTEPVIKLEWYKDRETGRRLLITVGMDRLLLVWDVETPQTPIFRLEFEHPPTSLRVNRDASLLAVGTYDSVLRVYALPSFECIASYVDLQMVIPHITWRSTHDCLAYNVFQMGRTVVLKPPRP